MNTPLVTIVIPTFNSERYLSAALESVLAQTYSPIEVLLIDAGSQDNTAAIAKAYGSVELRQQAGKGLADARNTGIRTARGELIAFLDSDDCWVPHKLSSQVNYLLAHPEIVFVTARVKLFWHSDCLRIAGFSQAHINDTLIGRTPSNLVAWKSAFTTVGLFDPTLSIGCDMDWFAQAKDAGIPAAILPEVLLYKRIHEHNLSANQEVNRQEILALVKKSIDRQKQRPPLQS